MRQKYAFIWKSREEMTATERRWKWVKQECLPEDLQKLMEQLTGKKKKKNDKKEEESGEEDQENKVKVEKEEFRTEIKHDYLSMDFTVYTTCQEVLEALREERVKSKYSADYHMQVLEKILAEMPC